MKDSLINFFEDMLNEKNKLGYTGYLSEAARKEYEETLNECYKDTGVNIFDAMNKNFRNFTDEERKSYLNTLQEISVPSENTEFIFDVSKEQITQNSILDILKDLKDHFILNENQYNYFISTFSGLDIKSNCDVLIRYIKILNINPYGYSIEQISSIEKIMIESGISERFINKLKYCILCNN